jgi:hypothetical protein
MKEKDILDARDIQANKKEMEHTITRMAGAKQDIAVRVGSVPLYVRASTLNELLDKEITYANRRLKSLGVTEIS